MLLAQSAAPQASKESELLDQHIAEGDRVAVSRKAEEAAGAVFSGMHAVAHDLLHIHFAQIGIEITLPLSSTLIVEPFTVTSRSSFPDRVLVPAGGGDHSVGGAVGLARVDLAAHFS